MDRWTPRLPKLTVTGEYNHDGRLDHLFNWPVRLLCDCPTDCAGKCLPAPPLRNHSDDEWLHGNEDLSDDCRYHHQRHHRLTDRCSNPLRTWPSIDGQPAGDSPPAAALPPARFSKRWRLPGRPVVQSSRHQWDSLRALHSGRPEPDLNSGGDC